MQGIVLSSEILDGIIQDAIYKLNSTDYTMGLLVSQGLKYNQKVFHDLTTEISTVIGVVKLVPKNTEIEFAGLMKVKDNEILFQLKRVIVDMNLENVQINIIMEKRIKAYLNM